MEKSTICFLIINFFQIVVLFLCVCVEKSTCFESETDLCSNRFCVCQQDLDTPGLFALNCSFDYQQEISISERSLNFPLFSNIDLSNLHELKILANTFTKDNSKRLKRIKFTNISQLHISSPFHNHPDLIHFENVTIPEILNYTFQSYRAHVRIIGSTVRIIRRQAFSATEINTVVFINSSIDHVEGEAFSDRTLIDQLTLVHVKLNTIDSNAIRSGVTSLSIQHSTISRIHSAGINSTVANVQLFNNVIRNIETNGIVLNNWNYIAIENNTLRSLSANALSVSNTENSFVFNFIGNALQTIDASCLSFNFGYSSNSNVSIYENYVDKACSCSFQTYLSDIVNNDFVNVFYETSACKIDKTLSECYKIAEGSVNIQNFTQSVCVQERACDAVTNLKPTTLRLFPDLTDTFESVFDEKYTATLIKYVVCIIVILALVILLIVSCVCIVHTGMLSKVKSNLFVNIYSKIFTSNNQSKSQSNAKMFANDYSELNKHVKLDINDIILDASNTSYDALYVSKATQTLPEQLTQELLQHLREKLDDPNEYSLARDMIEELYDRIKIEESCNRNNCLNDGENHYMSNEINTILDNPRSNNAKTDNIYDEIDVRPNRTSTSGISGIAVAAGRYPKVLPTTFETNQRNVLSTFQSNTSKHTTGAGGVVKPADTRAVKPVNKKVKKFVNVGTRVPSPDKLLPTDFPSRRNIDVLDEYQMPKDNNCSDVYSELYPPSAIQPEIPPLPREQLRLLDNAINIYIDSTLGRRGSAAPGVYNVGRPLPNKPDESYL